MTKKLDINTLEGWNEAARISHIAQLKSKGIKPTQENIDNLIIELNETIEKIDIAAAYKKELEGNYLNENSQDEILRLVKVGNKLVIDHDVPAFYYVDKMRFNSQEEALEYKDILATLESNPNLKEMIESTESDPELIKVAIAKINNLKDN